VLRVAGPAHAFPGEPGEEEVIPWLDQPPDPPRGVTLPNLLKSEKLDLWRTPANNFFVVGHYNEPVLKAKDWRLRIGGLVARPRSLKLPRNCWSRTSMRVSHLTLATPYHPGAIRRHAADPPPRPSRPYRPGARSHGARQRVDRSDGHRQPRPSARPRPRGERAVRRSDDRQPSDARRASLCIATLNVGRPRELRDPPVPVANRPGVGLPGDRPRLRDPGPPIAVTPRRLLRCS
jgi:hypothetical protein